MNVHLISQASLLVETAGVRILSDPWYGQPIYGEAWDLCPPVSALPDLHGIDALYISHAHPDHFHPPTLKRLLPTLGAGIPVLIPKLFFAEPGRSLRSIGFENVVEMAPDRSFDFKGLTLYSQQFRLNDSLLVIRGDETLISLNDCPIRGTALRDLARKYPEPDYVFAQFSIAQAYPYGYEDVPRDWDKYALIERFDSYARVLKPRFMVPFASFVRFCNQDNHHLNAHRIGLNELRARSTVPVTVLYPGDWIQGGEVVREDGSERRYEEALREQAVLPSRRAPLDTIEAALRGFLAALRRDVPGWLRARVPRAPSTTYRSGWRSTCTAASTGGSPAHRMPC